MVEFHNGKVGSIIYAKETLFDEFEIYRLLEANSFGKSLVNWKVKEPLLNETQRFEAEIGGERLVAIYISSATLGDLLQIKTQAFIEQKKKADELRRQEKARKLLSDF